MNRRRLRWALVPPLALGAAVLAQPAAAAEGFVGGVTLCLYSLLPALFPFFVVCTLVRAVIGQDRLPVLIGLAWLGGYAVCAELAVGMAPVQRRRLLLLGCCSGPGFVIGCLGGQLLGSVRLGVLLYGLQLACNLLAAALLLPWLDGDGATPPRTATALPARTAADLAGAIRRAVDSALAVGGCVVFFRVVHAVAATALPPAWRPWLSAALEISAGCADFAARGGPAALYGSCACLSLWGVSVFLQLRTLLGPDLPWRLLAVSRALHLVLLQGMLHLCVRFLPGVVPAFTNLPERVIPMQRLAPDAGLAVFCFLCAVLYKIRQRFYNGNRLFR